MNIQVLSHGGNTVYYYTIVYRSMNTIIYYHTIHLCARLFTTEIENLLCWNLPQVINYIEYGPTSRTQ